MTSESFNSNTSPWPHRWAVVLACATFPLVWIGGLVTTTDSGMAVPDWPNTYGYNLFLYPWKSWITGPWSLFLEHSHRLVAASVGMLTIGLLIVLWRCEKRAWVRNLGFAALGLVLFQGVLGGMRVLFDERTLAMLHGCTGPLFFALTVSIVVFTSRRWASGSSTLSIEENHRAFFGHIRRLAIVTFVLAYLQIMLGAVVRHVPVDAQPGSFALAVRFHLFLAAVLTLHVIMLDWSVWRHAKGIQTLGRFAALLGGLVVLQLLLGASTWIVKFAVPTWAAGWISVPYESVQQGGWLQTHVITAHVAVGSLILVTSLTLALFAQRLLPAGTSSQPMPARKLEAAV